MDSQYLGLDIAHTCAIILTLTVSAMFFYWWKRLPIGSKIEELRSYTQRLNLKILNAEGLSIFEAVADQLSLLNPNGSYTADKIKHQVKRRETISFLKKVRRHLNIWIEQEMWKGYLEELNAIADAYQRIIEVVHCDRKETVVIRPNGAGVTRIMQTVYIGYGGQGRFYSLRPESEMKSVEGKLTTNSLNNSNSLVTSNVLIGDSSTQYLFGLPRDQDEEYALTKNIVVGNNTSQNILATFRTSKGLIDFLNEMESSGTEGSEHRLRLKIRESSSTLSDEQLNEKHKRIVLLLEDKCSEARRELDEELKSLNVTYEKATLECILLHLKLDTLEKLRAFVNRFRAGDLEKVMVIIARQWNSNSTYDVQLHLCINLSASEMEKMSNLNRYISKYPNKKTILKPKRTPSGFSLVICKKADRAQGSLVSPEILTQKVAEATVESLSKAQLLEGTSGIDFHFEKLCSLQRGMYTKEASRDTISQNASETISERLRGCVGVISVDSVHVGNCFRVGSKYIMTALHVVKAAVNSDRFGDNCLGEEIIHVEFPDVDEKCLAKKVFCDAAIDIAVLKLATEITERAPINRVITCHPGHSFYTISYRKSSKKTRRAFIVSTDYISKHSLGHFVVFESGYLEHGESGSPGFTTNIDGETCLVTMLLGSMTSSREAWYYGVKMTEVKKRISKEDPYLAYELFGPFNTIFVKKTPFYYQDKRRRMKNRFPRLAFVRIAKFVLLFRL